MASVPTLPPVAGALSPFRADLISSPKRIRSPKLATDLEGCSEDSFEPYVPREVGLGVNIEDESFEQSRSRGTDLEVDDDVERSDGMDIDPVEAVIEACFDFADIIRASGVDVRVEVVTVSRDDVETGMRDPIVVSNDGDTPPVVPEVIPEPTQEGAAGSMYETLGDLVQRFHDHTEAIPVHRMNKKVGIKEMEMEVTEEMEMEATEEMRIEVTEEMEMEDNALTWWNSYKRTIGVDAAYAMNWAGLMTLMTEVYCPRNEIQKMETELWNLIVKGNDLTAYTQRFQELILLCNRMVSDKEDKVERFIGGLPENIQGNVIDVNPARLQDAIRIANQLMDKKLQGYAARSAKNKRRMESNPKDNYGQQPPFKRQNVSGQNVARAYTAENNERKG
ncbi:reverse transcriptase domain-containing protein, partial [Tanacetum coccineum]